MEDATELFFSMMVNKTIMKETLKNEDQGKWGVDVKISETYRYQKF